MLLDRIDIDNHGPLNRVELGPFGECLNVVCAPEGSGKTAIARFIRDSLIRREYPLGMMSSSAGRVVWADRDGKIHCRREHDGTATGRRTIEFESRGDSTHRFDWLHSSWIKGIADSTDASRSLESIRIPESLVDGILVDTAVTSVSRVIQACLQNGLDDPALFASLPRSHSSVSGVSPFDSETEQQTRRVIRDELARIEAELATLPNAQANAPVGFAPYGYPAQGSRPPRAAYVTSTSMAGYTPAQQAARRAQLHSRLDSLRATQRANARSVHPHYPDVSASHDGRAIQAEIDWILAELKWLNQVDRPIPVEPPRLTWLKTRRAELIQKLGVPGPNHRRAERLADEASQWLVRLSGGRLRRVDWNSGQFTTAPKQVALVERKGLATIDGLSESNCPASDRALAALAIRLAAADLLARTERTLPLVIEMHRELLQLGSKTLGAAHGSSHIEPGNQGGKQSVLAALDDFARQGRQVIVLCSDGVFADAVSRRGGKTFAIRPERVEHDHRPLWRPHYDTPSYAGPHAGAHLPDGQVAAPQPAVPHSSDVFVDRYYDQYFDNLPMGASLADINRNLDTIWQEAYGALPGHDSAQINPLRSPSAPAGPTPVAPASKRPDTPSPYVTSPGDNLWHDGYFFADTFTTAPKPSDTRDAAAESSIRTNTTETQELISGSKPTPASPFYLTVDSPIDQAPSVDAVAASRLRRLNVTHINHLLSHDPNRLSDALGLSAVTAATIRRWQSECKLVCHVPQLRGFDARILIGSGIRDAAQLASTDPNHLLDRVEAFLATERGQRILLSGTSYELSRITSWLAAANVLTDEETGQAIGQHATIDGHVLRQQSGAKPNRATNNGATNNGAQAPQGLGDTPNRYEYEFVDDNGNVVRASSKRSRLVVTAPPANRTTKTSRRRRSGETGQRTSRRSRNGERVRHELAPAVDSHQQIHPEDGATETIELRFYLERESMVVDAPSIGAKMAEKLASVGVETVDDLLNLSPEDLALRLDQRRVDAEIVTAWQNQAILVCRIPMLRGHDAQLLVAAGVNTPEEVAEYNAQELFEMIDPIARSNEGQRILRGGKLPDLAEISEWIRYAALNRELIAA